MAHTHDGIDWPARLAAMRRADEVNAQANGAVAERLVGLVGDAPTVVDIGPGAGGMSAALATALQTRGGGRLVLVDAVPELLEAAGAHVGQVLGDAEGKVEVSSVRVDAASDELAELLPEVDLVWASRVVHHLPDQQKGIEGLVRVLGPGGWLALAEGGLPGRYLPWDLGVGEPGLGARISAAHVAWFADMRAGMAGVTRLPVGWNRALTDAGLAEVTSFSYLVDLPPPATELVQQSVVDWLSWTAAMTAERLSAADQVAVARLLDPIDPAYVGARDDVFILGASTVHLGRKISG
ncbi:class I SAM-dependent methyltransferase [Actinophytocola sp.]|uniref:class I SAM-dependent methyltransferase n=1 Tax=Actinophytocola sp. TaxID=1872138 RepID=UPI002D8033B3|nr:methyltransferase [Actinophytocola sp.]HET9138019.1 methyltransferase [Actinophytocola sp.]